MVSRSASEAADSWCPSSAKSTVLWGLSSLPSRNPTIQPCHKCGNWLYPLGDRRMFQSKRSQTSQIMQPPKMPRIVRDRSNRIGRYVPLSQSGGRCYDITHVNAAVAEHTFRFLRNFEENAYDRSGSFEHRPISLFS